MEVGRGPAPVRSGRVESERLIGVRRLRWGLHGLVAVLAAAVAVRALVLGAAHTPVIVTLVAAVMVIVGVGAAGPRGPVARELWLGVLVALWLVLTALGADAAYISFGLILLAFAESTLVLAAAWTVGITAANIVIGTVFDDRGIGVVVGAVLGAVIGVVAGLGFKVLFRETELRQALIDRLRSTQHELAAEQRRAGELAERQRLAHEIHDTVAQGLSSIQMLLRAVDTDGLDRASAARLGTARECAASGLDDVRGLIADLAPTDLDGASLADALARVCRRAGDDPPITFTVRGEARPTPMTIQAALVRLVQGAVSNVVRHARAERARVELVYTADTVGVTVTDDGVGFDTAVLTDAGAHTFGLDIMRRRVAELGGAWSVVSAPGRTVLEVDFELCAPAAANARDEAVAR